MKLIDLTGQRFGKLIVLSLSVEPGRKRKWFCRCDCGNEKAIIGAHLTNGNSRACGFCRGATLGNNKHGHTAKNQPCTPTYGSWKSMRYRCSHKPEYVGIEIDPRWADFSAFLEDMGERPKGHTLDRRDNNKGYSKDNCRWATPTEQTRNRRIAKVFTKDGMTKPVVEWAKERGMKYAAVAYRIRRYGALEIPACSPIQ